MTNLKLSREELEIILSKDAKAGNYVPSPLTRLLGAIYPHTKIKGLGLLPDSQIVILDISFYQVIADFVTMKDAGVEGVIIRAGQNLWEDSKAKVFMDGAKANGMPFGSYWFFDSRISPQKQAELWASILEGYDTKLWIWADYEENYGGAYGGWRNFYDFLEECKRLMPNRKIGIYTGYYYWIEHSPNPITQAASLNYFKQYPLWLAWYSNNITDVKIPRPWTELVFWQHTSSGDGYAYGVGSREVDMNKFLGSDFTATFELETGNGGEEPMPEEPITYYMDLRPGFTSNIRSGAGQEFPIIQPITGPITVSIVGQALDSPNDGYEWYKIALPIAGFVAKTTSYQNFRPVLTPPTGLPDTLYIGTLPDGSDVEKYVKEA